MMNLRAQKGKASRRHRSQSHSFHSICQDPERGRKCSLRVEYACAAQTRACAQLRACAFPRALGTASRASSGSTGAARDHPPTQRPATPGSRSCPGAASGKRLGVWDLRRKFLHYGAPGTNSGFSGPGRAGAGPSARAQSGFPRAGGRGGACSYLGLARPGWGGKGSVGGVGVHPRNRGEELEVL